MCACDLKRHARRVGHDSAVEHVTRGTWQNNGECGGAVSIYQVRLLYYCASRVERLSARKHANAKVDSFDSPNATSLHRLQAVSRQSGTDRRVKSDGMPEEAMLTAWKMKMHHHNASRYLHTRSLLSSSGQRYWNAEI